VGDYLCSITYEVEKKLLEKRAVSAESSVGIYLGVEKFVTLSSGIVIDNPHLRRVRRG